MYRLKRLLIRHIEENTIKYIVILLLFALGIAMGMFFSQTVSDNLSQSLFEELSGMVEGCSAGETDTMQILTASFMKNFRVIGAIFISGLAMWMLPVGSVMLMSYGFSLGFTMGYMSFCFGGQGVGITAISLMPSFLVNIPVYIILWVIAVNNSINRRHHHGDNGAYMIIFLLAFVVSNISVVADALFIPNIISLICS